MIAQVTKTCTKCGKEKPLEEFALSSYVRKDGTRGRRAKCKICHAECVLQWQRTNREKVRKYNRQWNQANPEKARERNLHWRRANSEKHAEHTRRWRRANRFAAALSASRRGAKRLGHMPCMATPEEIEAAFTGKCHSCGLSEKDHGKLLCVDHNHETGKFRGWLCSRCNHGIGLFDDSHGLLMDAVAYLRRNSR